MIRNTPDVVARWLRATLETRQPGHPERQILERLANDEGMAALWDQGEAGGWPVTAQIMLVEYVSFLAGDGVLSALLQPPETRIDLVAAGQWALAAAAEMLLKEIEHYPDDAARLWAGETLTPAEVDPAPLHHLASRLRAFAERARTEAEAFRAAFDHVPAPSGQGRGDRRQLAYRSALDSALSRLPGITPTQQQRDRLVALLSNVVFGSEVDADTIARTRQRQMRRDRKN